MSTQEMEDFISITIISGPDPSVGRIGIYINGGLAAETQDDEVLGQILKLIVGRFVEKVRTLTLSNEGVDYIDLVNDGFYPLNFSQFKEEHFEDE